MLRWILGSIVISEAVVGTSLTVLLLLGRADPVLTVNVLSVVGFAILALGLLPLLSKIRNLALDDEDAGSQHEGAEAELNTGSRLRNFAVQYEHFFRALLIGGVVIGTAFGLNVSGIS